MKPLQLLDHVMLWIARAFGLWCLGWMIYYVVEIVDSEVWVYHRYVTLHRQWDWTQVFRADDYEILFLLTVVLLWNIALWLPRKEIGRFYLLLSGILLFLFFLWRAVDGLLFYSSYMDASEWIFTGPCLAGYFAMAWTAFRAPGQLPLSFSPTMRPRATTSKRTLLIFPSFFRHSVSSV
jgi:hypothetical protein